MTQQHIYQTAGGQLLIVPGGTPRLLDCLQKCKRKNRSIIEASSLCYQVGRHGFGLVVLEGVLA